VNAGVQPYIMRFDYNTSYADRLKLLRYPEGKLAYAMLAVLLCIAPFVLPKFYVGELTYLFMLCIASLGLMLLTGFTGQVSLGHAAFAGIGAYTHAILLAKGVPLVLSIAGGALVAGFAGLAIAFPARRLSGLYLAMVTLAFSFVVEHVLGRWTSVTGGFNGMAVGKPSLFGIDVSGFTPFYFFCLAWLAVVTFMLVNLMRSRTGRAFIGVRDSEAAAHGLGIYVPGYKLLAFALSAAIVGLAGGLLAHHTSYLTPEAFGLLFSIELVLMVVIGGLGSLHGAIFGAVLIGLLPPLISHVKPLLPARVANQSGLEIFVFGFLLVLFVLFEPKGLYGRWLKVKGLVQTFPLYRKDTFRRGKSYMRSERYR
jgi:branched-chain amino acid transport system permease protein